MADIEKKQSKGVSQRKGLADITNLQSKQKVSNEGKAVLMCDQAIVQQLRQENGQLVERNKMCEIEVQNLRAKLQKYEWLNLQLAQQNSRMHYEINAAKDKGKILSHELACRKAAETLQILEVKSGMCQQIDSKRTTFKKGGVSSVADANHDKPCSSNSGQHSRAFHSAVGIQSAAKSAMTEEDPDSRRYQMRRQSSRFESVDLEPVEDMPNTNGVAFQSMDKRPEACPMSETGKGSQEAFVSSSADINGSRPCSDNDKHPGKAKRESNVKHASNSEKFETKRPRTRSSMLIFEEQQDFKVDTRFKVSTLSEDKMLEDCPASLSPAVNTKDVVKKQADLEDVRKIQDLKATLQDDNPCSSGTKIGQLRATGLSTTKGTSQVEKTEIERLCSSKQSSRLKCLGKEPSGCDPQSGNNNEIPENHSVQMMLPEITEKMERQETAVLPEQVKRSSLGRPLRRAAEKVQSYKEIPLNVKMRRP